MPAAPRPKGPRNENLSQRRQAAKFTCFSLRLCALASVYFHISLNAVASLSTPVRIAAGVNMP